MTNKQMEYFEAVCRTGNITTAAEELFVSRSVISRAIQELENEFSAVLLIRSHDGVVPTFSGEILREYFAEVRGGYEALQNSLQKLSDRSHVEPLRVGITGTCGCRFYPRLFRKFRDRFPEIRINVSEHSAYDAYELVAAGKIDFFFTPVSGYNRSSLGELDMESMLARRECYRSQTVFLYVFQLAACRAQLSDLRRDKPAEFCLTECKAAGRMASACVVINKPTTTASYDGGRRDTMRDFAV